MNENRGQNFTIGPFTFKLRGEENTSFINYEITHEDISIPFQIVAIDTSKECGPRSNLNFVDFIWNYLVLLKFKLYATVVILFDTPRILYLKHHRAASEGWKTNL